MRILIIDDEPYVEALIKGWFRSAGHEMEFLQTGAHLLRQGPAELQKYDVAIIDKQLPEADGLRIGRHLKDQCPEMATIMVTGFESTDTLVAAFRDSRFDDYISKPFDSRKLQDALLRAQKLVEERRALSSEYKLNETLRLRSVELPRQLVGQSPKFQEMMALIDKFAPLDGPILIRGETGTGKELVAREIYKRSRRKNGPFVPVNCGAIPAELFESELFGHEKGAFTGAIGKKDGLVKLADAGTLFLDEIGDTPLALQVKLLRMLQEGEILPIGSTRHQRVNVRVISATNQSLEEQIKAREFREDLLYRLNVFTIQLPPLRERQEDLPMLVQHFIQKNANLNPRVVGIDPNALEMLRRWPWEGNIRELENVIQRTCALSESEYLRPEDFKEIYYELVQKRQSVAVPHNLPEAQAGEDPSSNSFTLVRNEGGVNSVMRQAEQLWHAFRENGWNLWKIENREQAHADLARLLETATYIKVGHFGRIQTAKDEVLPVQISYLNPETCRVERLDIHFNFYCENSLAAAPISASFEFARDNVQCHRIHQPVKKGLPDTYLFNLLYRNRHRNQTISISPQHIIRALVLRYAQMDTPVRPLKKVFDDLMDFLVDEDIVQLFPYLPHDGLEAMRGCLCSKAHVFSGFSSKLKANPNLVAQEIRKVFPDYSLPFAMQRSLAQ